VEFDPFIKSQLATLGPYVVQIRSRNNLFLGGQRNLEALSGTAPRAPIALRDGPQRPQPAVPRRARI